MEFPRNEGLAGAKRPVKDTAIRPEFRWARGVDNLFHRELWRCIRAELR